MGNSYHVFFPEDPTNLRCKEKVLAGFCQAPCAVDSAVMGVATLLLPGAIQVGARRMGPALWRIPKACNQQLPKHKLS